MSVKAIEDVIGFIEESFSGGRASRELRLSREEIEYIRRIYPRLSLKEMHKGFCDDGKLWVEASFEEAI